MIGRQLGIMLSQPPKAGPDGSIKRIFVQLSAEVRDSLHYVIK
jgi:hypothetical protein